MDEAKKKIKGLALRDVTGIKQIRGAMKKSNMHAELNAKS